MQQAPRLSIVVLPFTNLSRDPAQEYFADGITEDVTTDLSRIHGSFVIARNTADTFKGKPMDVRQIAKEVGVRYALEGSVQRDGNAVRVTAQLIDAETGAHLWADRFDGERTNLFELQNQITGRIANALRIEVVSAASRQAKDRRYHDADALDYVMQGRGLRTKPLTRDNLEEAQELFERAIMSDSRLPDAWAGPARALATQEFNFPDAARADKLRRGEEAATKALALEPNYAEARVAHGVVLLQLGRFSEASAELETAIRLDPNDVNAYSNLALVAVFLGHPERAFPLWDQAMRLSPFDPYLPTWQTGYGWAKLLVGDDDGALQWASKARSTNARYAWAYVVLGAANARLARRQKRGQHWMRGGV
jgi:adenylate cyclase